ncbi:hypothetical protein CTEN210_01013 [Chaetoceros tenuissimus]|uniref:Uncharacterized protein n=1 Tax=Chaetoceros tenuissimus TaxID=426638 RepID=A0AAD3GZP2_9STRA|nr:hypothetical protein CTEN210_01013 [Chaetoceros tenuissimus]
MSTPEEQIAQLNELVNGLTSQLTTLNQQVTDQGAELQVARAQATQAAQDAQAAQAAQANQAQANQQGNQGNQQVNFALNPVRATTNVIDMFAKNGIKMYELGVAKVHSILYNGKPENVNFFRANVHKKAVKCGWYDAGGNIFNIEDNSVTPSKTYDIVYQTQEVPLSVIENFATANIVGQQNRAAQNNEMAVQSLFDSLDEDMVKRMMADELSYTLQNIAVAPLLFRSIISKSEMPGRGQVKVLKDQFKELREKIKGMDIETFNDHVRGLNTSLAAFGHQMPNEDLVQDLLTAYKHSDDTHFNEHFKKKEVKWLKGEIDIEFKELLQDGQAEYSSRKYDKESSWGALSSQDQEIIALSAKVQMLEKNAKKKRNTPTGGGGDQGENKDRGTPRNRGKDAWKFSNVINGKTYKSGDKIIKGGKEFWWCPHHHENGMWCRHKPVECTNNPSRNSTQDTPVQSPSNNSTDETADAATEDAPTAEESEALLSNFEVASDEE